MIPPIITVILSIINFAVSTTIIVWEWIMISKKLPTILDDKERNRTFHKIQLKLEVYPFLSSLLICFLIWQNGFFQTAHGLGWTIIAVSIALFSLLFALVYVKTERKYNVKRMNPPTTRGSRNGSEGLFFGLSLGLLIYQIVLLFL